MKQQFGLIRRPWGVFYLKNKITGEQTSLKTRDKGEAERLLQTQNDAQSQPHFNLALARVYINGADPKLGTRTWQEVMEHIVAKNTDETRQRWEVAVKDRNFDCIRNLAVAETRPDHFDRALADGKISTNVYLRRIHNHATARFECSACHRIENAIISSNRLMFNNKRQHNQRSRSPKSA